MTKDTFNAMVKTVNCCMKIKRSVIDDMIKYMRAGVQRLEIAIIICYRIYLQNIFHLGILNGVGGSVTAPKLFSLNYDFLLVTCKPLGLNIVSHLISRIIEIAPVVKTNIMV